MTGQDIKMTALDPTRMAEAARMAESGLMAGGRVFTLSLDAVRQGLGARWTSRKESVWEAAERALTRTMPLPDVFVQIDEATILAGISSAGPYEGQVRCADAMRSLMAHFLGREAEGDIRIDRVLSLDRGVLQCAPIDLSAPRPDMSAAAGAGVAPRHPSAQTSLQWSPPVAGRRTQTALATDHCGNIPMTLELLPVWRLDRGVISAYAFRRRLPVKAHALTDADRERAAHLTLDHVLPILDAYRRDGGAFALIVPCALDVISVRRSRQAILDRCAPLADIMRKVVILELEGWSAGVPAGRTRETASMIRPFVLGLTVNVATGAEACGAMREFGFNGLALDAGATSALKPLTEAARRRMSNIVVHNAPASLEAEELHQWGASHATWRPAAPRLDRPQALQTTGALND